MLKKIVTLKNMAAHNQSLTKTTFAFYFRIRNPFEPNLSTVKQRS